MEELYDIITKHLGTSGRMISASKSGYSRLNPVGYPVFNANLVAAVGGGLLKKTKFVKVWYGDLDLVKDYNVIKAAALDMGHDLYVLKEMDARFDNEDKPKMDSFVCMTDGEIFKIGPGGYALSTDNDKLVRKDR